VQSRRGANDPPSIAPLRPEARPAAADAAKPVRHALLTLLVPHVRAGMPKLVELVQKFVGPDGRRLPYGFNEPDELLEAFEQLVKYNPAAFQWSDKLQLLKRVLAGYDDEGEPPSVSLAHRASDNRNRPLPLIIVYSQARREEKHTRRGEREAEQLKAQARRRSIARPPPRARR